MSSGKLVPAKNGYYKLLNNKIYTKKTLDTTYDPDRPVQDIAFLNTGELVVLYQDAVEIDGE